MDAKRLVAGLLAGGIIALGAVASADAAASADNGQRAAPQRPGVLPERARAALVATEGNLMGAGFSLFGRQEDNRGENGRRGRQRGRQIYGGAFFGGYGLGLPYGAYVYGPTTARAPQPYWPQVLYSERGGRLLIVVQPTDEPGATYYYNSFPYYYARPGYFPGSAYAGPGVTIVSPTVPQVAPQAPGVQKAPQPAAQKAQQPGELQKAAFLSALAPMLGGKPRVSLDFAVGELKLRQGDYAGAAKALRRAVGDVPDDCAPKLALGLALAGSGDYAGAAQIIRRGLRGMADWRALKLAPDRAFGGAAAYQSVLTGLKAAGKANKDAHFILGFLYVAGGRYADAVQELMQADRKDAVVLGLMSEAQRRRQAEESAAKPAAQGKAG